MSMIKINVNADITPETQAKILEGGSKFLEPFGIGLGILSDKIAYYRLKCLIEITEKAKQLLEKNGYDPKPVSEKFLSRFIEGSSIENEEEIQSMWANLLAGEAINSDNIIFINILKELNKTAAILLEEIYKRALDHNYDLHEDFLEITRLKSYYGGTVEDVKKYENSPNMFLISAASTSLKGRKTQAAKDNFEILSLLEQIGLIRITSYLSEKNNDCYSYAVYASISPLGYKFMSACTRFEKGLENENQ